MARLTKLTAGDKLIIRLKVDKLHAATPADEVVEAIRKCFTKNVSDMVTPGYITQAEAYTRKIHAQNYITWRRWNASF